MTVFTRSNNDELFEMMVYFFSTQTRVGLFTQHSNIRACTWFNHWTDAESYLHFIIQQGDGWIINCDNDCFIHDKKRLTELRDYMEANGYTHCGMRDAGTCPHRNNDHQVMNPFFNIFNADAIKPMLKDIQPVENNIEPYNSFFIHLHNHGKPLYLDAATRSDGITTHLMDHNRNYFALHSWYSRNFNHDEFHRNRILNVYEDAKYYKR